MSSDTTTASYWCYSCTRMVRAQPDSHDGVSCPYCGGGFVEEIESENPGRQFPAMYLLTTNRQDASRIRGLGIRRNRRRPVNWSNVNPIIALRSSTDGDRENPSYEFFYEESNGSGLRPVPESMSQSLTGLGFDRLLEQLSQIELTGIGHPENPPASKSSIESMPRVPIESSHVTAETHCAVCKDPFELGGEARSMPCKHIFHEDCIIPWLSIRNSCPLCRHEMPADRIASSGTSENGETVGLSIWRLPGGVFAVGRFRGEREVPRVYTEVDGVFESEPRPTRSEPWIGLRRRESRFRRVIRNLTSVFRNSRTRVSDSDSGAGVSISRSRSSTSAYGSNF